MVNYETPKGGFGAKPNYDFTVQDLLKARDLYHNALAVMPNVVATAIGKYLYTKEDSREIEPRRKRKARTLLNSYLAEESYPAVLVLIKKWIEDPRDFKDPRQVVPQFLYLPDGRAVPTCVILVELAEDIEWGAPGSHEISFPENLIGGGCGVYTRVQGSEHIGTVGCLVTDGERIYGLTARHVVGPGGQPVYTRVRDEEVLIGQTDNRQILKVKFEELYPGYGCQAGLTTVDVGLVRLEDADQWTSQLLGIGWLDDLANFSPANITFDLLGTPLRSYGASSRDRMYGEISALFPRYRSVGGVDYLADLAIAPRRNRPDALAAAAGDSGSLWVLDDETAARGQNGAVTPVALTWGAMDLAAGVRSQQLVLATFLSTICKSLDIELVTRHNIGYRPIWGEANHHLIAEASFQLVGNEAGNLPSFLQGTGNRRGERGDALRDLAMLPDNWKTHKGRCSREKPNHYANMDLDWNGRPLSEVTLTAKAWLGFYVGREKDGAEDGGNRGALPFRIQAVYEALTKYIQARELKNAFAAAGVLTHYVADACNPAHVSRWGRGDPGWTAGQRGDFHSIWDNPTIDTAAVISAFGTLKPRPPIGAGKDALAAARELMLLARKRVPVGEFVSSEDAAASKRNARTFCKSDEGQQALAACAANGCSFLLALWRGAWTAGGGAKVSAAALAGFNVQGIHDELLDQSDFLPSFPLKELAAVKTPKAKTPAKPKKRPRKKPSR